MYAIKMFFSAFLSGLDSGDWSLPTTKASAWTSTNIYSLLFLVNYILVNYITTSDLLYIFPDDQKTEQDKVGPNAWVTNACAMSIRYSLI